MFYLLFFETFERTEMTRKVFYIDFSEVFERNQMYRKMFYIYFFMHMKISLTSKTVLSFIPSGKCLRPEPDREISDQLVPIGP